MLNFQGFANSRIVREFPPFSFKVRIATLTRNQFAGNRTWVRIPPAAPRRSKRGHEYAAYRLGKEYLTGENIPKDAAQAAAYMQRAAEQANPYAQYLLGKLYLMGDGVPKDKESAQYWFSMAEQNGHAYAGYFLDRMERQDDLPPPNILLSATRLLHHMSSIFRNNAPRPAAPTGIQIDHKRLQRLREKKMAMGHKWNDHEDEQNQGMGGM